jgi:osmotically-inducible protein OsmY
MTSIKLFRVLFVAAMLASAAGCAGTPQKEATGEYADDTLITTKVKAAILHSPALKVAEINVETFKGTVQLSGFVRSRDAMNEAVRVASGVKGVKAVSNDMRLK